MNPVRVNVKFVVVFVIVLNTSPVAALVFCTSRPDADDGEEISTNTAEDVADSVATSANISPDVPDGDSPSDDAPMPRDDSAADSGTPAAGVFSRSTGESSDPELSNSQGFIRENATDNPQIQ